MAYPVRDCVACAREIPAYRNCNAKYCSGNCMISHFNTKRRAISKPRERNHAGGVSVLLRDFDNG